MVISDMCTGRKKSDPGLRSLEKDPNPMKT